jgi:type I restriction enzyme S subunit
MSHGWPVVPLGDVLTKSDEWVSIDLEKLYQEVTVRLWGNGVVQRRVALGAEIAAPTRVVVHAH